MADDRTKSTAQDRRQVAGSQPHEVDYFAKKNGITRQQVQQLIKEVGNDREKLTAAAMRLKGQQQG